MEQEEKISPQLPPNYSMKLYHPMIIPLIIGIMIVLGILIGVLVSMRMDKPTIQQIPTQRDTVRPTPTIEFAPENTEL